MKSFYEVTLTSGTTHSFWLEGKLADVIEQIEDNIWIGDDEEVVRCTDIEHVKFEGTEEDLK